MTDPGARRVVAAIPDLLLATRVAEGARAAGVDLATATLETLAERCRDQRPDLVVVDLASPGDPTAAIAELRATPGLAAVPVLGFYPHVHDRLRVAALAAGATHVLPRSAFVARLAEVLAGTFPARR